MGRSWLRALTAATVLLVIGGLAVPALAARGRGDLAKSAAASGTIRFSDWLSPDTLNPFQAGEPVDFEIMDLTMPTGMALYYGPHGNILPGFLQRVPTRKNGGISKDGKTITLIVRKGLRWSNGQPITAADAKFAWEVAKNPLIGDCTGTCDNIGSITVKGSYELIWHMKSVYGAAIPDAWTGFLPHSWSKLGGSASKAAATVANSSFTYESPSYVTAGPYKVSKVTASQIVLMPNPYYHAMGGSPRVARYIFQHYPDTSALISAAANHKTDLTQNYTLTDLRAVQSHGSAFTTKSVATLSPEHIELNVRDKTVGGHANPLVNQKVRQAISLAINRRAIIAHVYGAANKAVADAAITYDAPWIETATLKQPYADPRISGAWDPLRKRWIPYGATSVSDAKKLLAGTPCAKGCSLSLVSTIGNVERAAEASVIKKNLSAIGIKLSYSTQSSGRLFGTWQQGGTLVHGNFEMALFAFVGVTPDPDGWKFNMEGKYVSRLDPNHSPIDSNNSGLNDPIVNNAFEAAAHTMNTATRRSDYYRAQEEISKQVPWITTAVLPMVVTYDAKVKGVTMNRYATVAQWNGYSWRS